MKGKKAWVLPVCNADGSGSSHRRALDAVQRGRQCPGTSGQGRRPSPSGYIPSGTSAIRRRWTSLWRAFNKEYPDIQVTVGYLDYQTGDEQVSAAIAAGTTPDVIMEGPERLVAGWGQGRHGGPEGSVDRR